MKENNELNDSIQKENQSLDEATKNKWVDFFVRYDADSGIKVLYAKENDKPSLNLNSVKKFMCICWNTSVD